MSATAQKLNLNLHAAGFHTPKLTTLLSTSTSSTAATADNITVAPFTALILKLTQ